jgi:DNA-binding CsgD family transcriptional regulator
MPGRSQQVSFEEARTMFAVVQECLERWADPAEWQAHLLRRAAALTNCRVGLCYEVADGPDEPASRLLSAADVGWVDDGERRRLVEGISLKPLSYSPMWVSMTRAMSHDRPLTRRQSRLLDDRRWYASEIYDHHVRPTRIGTAMMSAIRMPHRSTWSVWCLTNDRSDKALTERQERLMAMLHESVAPLIGTRLCAAHQRSVNGLSARRRDVLGLLLAGQTEKEIARNLCRSRGAVHEHVSFLYKHFGVSSRAELAAYFIERRPVDGGTTPRFDAATWLKRPNPALSTL